MRIAVIYPPPFLDSTPCLYNLVQRLADSGFELEVYTGDDDRFTKPQFKGAITTHFHKGSRRSFPSWLNQTLNREGLGSIIAMDRWGVLSAARATRSAPGIPLIYFNVELYVPPIFSGWKHILMNSLEAWIVRRRAQIVLTPSKERGAALTKWYVLDAERVLTIPNSPRGAAGTAKGDYLQRKYDIRPDKVVLLYFGSLTSANRIEELIASARNGWPEEFVLVLHGRQQADENTHRWFEDKTRGSKCRIILSPHPLAPVELNSMVRSADLGIALYPTEGVGFQTMGTSAGKIAEYLYSGVPVITSRVRSLERIFAVHPNAGRVVNKADDIPQAARHILAEGPMAREAAVKCFEDRFSFDKHFDEFLKRFRSLVG